jgi:DNA invertase Pin-like site-specific DNA recombinase
MKAIGYVRVSSEEQRRKGVSLDAQREKIRAYCDLNDLELVRIEADEGVSGKTISARPAVQRVLRAAKRKEADVVVVYKIDRLARNYCVFWLLCEGAPQ